MAKNLISVDNSIERILRAGLSVAEHDNSGGCGEVIEHLTIIGGVRRVEFYPSTGTVYANAVKGKYKATSSKGIECAIRLALEGRV